MASFLRVTIQLPDGRLITTSTMEEAAFCSYWNRHSGYRFAFPSCYTSVKTDICGLRERLICHQNITHSIASGQGTHFTRKEVWQRACAHGIHWAYHVSHNPEAGSLIEWPFENSVRVSESWQYLAGQGKGSPEGGVCSDPVSNTWCYFSHSQIHRSRSQGVEMGTAHCYLSDPLATFLLPVPVTLCLLA